MDSDEEEMVFSFPQSLDGEEVSGTVNEVTSSESLLPNTETSGTGEYEATVFCLNNLTEYKMKCNDFVAEIYMNPESEDEDQGEDQGEDEDHGDDEDENEDTNENLEESQLAGQDGSDEALLSSFQSMLHEMSNIINVN